MTANIVRERSRTAPAVLLGLAACTVPNPKYRPRWIPIETLCTHTLCNKRKLPGTSIS